MEIAKRLVKKLGGWQYTIICLLLVTNLVIHFAIINDPPLLVLDEQHYIGDARNILQEHTTDRTEHPPLGKLIITSGVALFGDNPFGWRTFSILFGTANIFLLFLICRRLGMSPKGANLAAFLLTFENLSFVQGSIAMLDVFSLTFTLLAFWLYLRGNYPLSGFAVALATLAKLSGAFALIVIGLHWLITRRKGLLYFAASMMLAPLGFFILMPPLQFAIYHHLTNFVVDIQVMLARSASLTFSSTTHPSLVRPWTLLILPKVMPYYYNPHYFGAISFTLWALTIPTFIYMIVKAVKKNVAGLFGAIWFFGTYLIWIPISLITDRVSYPYYFYPAVGAICIGLGMGLSGMIDFWRTKKTGKLRWLAISAVVLFLLLHFAVFVILAPVNPWPVENFIFSTPITH